MFNYIVRVELHGVLLTAPLYTQLHGAMERLGFSRQVRAADGTMHWLPPAMYAIFSGANLETVRQLAANAAASTGRSSTIFVAQTTGAWAAFALAPVVQSPVRTLR